MNKSKTKFGTGSPMSKRQDAYRTVKTERPKHTQIVASDNKKGALPPKLQKIIGQTPRKSVWNKVFSK